MSYDGWVFGFPNPWNFVDCKYTFLELVPFHVQLSSKDILWLWHLQNPEVSNTIQASLTQLQTTASSGLHIRTPLPNTWLPWLSLFREEDSTLYSCILHDSKPMCSAGFIPENQVST